MMQNEINDKKRQGETKSIQPDTTLHTNGSGNKRDGRDNRHVQQQNQKALKVKPDHRSEDMAKHRRGTFP